jgi:Carboxypeptidase regulatory-like domain
MRKLIALALGLALLAFVPILSAQTVSGNISGTVADKDGGVIPQASITAVNTATGLTKTTTANEQGEFLFVDLPPGSYNLTATAAGFAKTTISAFPVQLNRTNSVHFTLAVATQSISVEVSGATPPINTSTSQIEGTFESKQTADLPVSSIGPLGVLNLALLQPGVTTSGGVGYGAGPSVGGQRPTNNNFTIEGVDNNDKSVTGPLVVVPNDAVAEFSALQNQFSPEFGHSNGGQFNTVVESGTNVFHGKLYEYFENRNLNAIDNQQALNTPAGQTPTNPRFDFNRVGGQLGGPILKDKLFFFANGEYNPLGQAGTPVPSSAPTAAGYTALAALAPGPNPNGTATNVSLNMNNLAQLQKYVTPASVATGNIVVCTGGSIPAASGACPLGTAVSIPVGNLQFNAPNFTNSYFLTTSGDYNMSAKDQFRIRYIYNRVTGIDFNAQLPVFFTPSPFRFHLVAINQYHTFTPSLTNELRLGFNRFTNQTPAGSFTFPGLDAFPNLVFNDLGVQLGPDPNAPSTTDQNTYQVSENLSWTHKNHNLKLGVEARRYIAPNTFTQRARGDYEYSSLGTYLYDINPDGITERSTGTLVYYGDLVDSSWYISDTWRVRPSLSLNFGMRYEYATIPFGERLQSLNIASSVPGLIDFSEPRAPKNQFMPRVGFAWSPDKNQTWSIRGGWSMGYDVLYDNLGLNSISAGTVPQLGATIDKDQATVGILNNFLANGAIAPGTGGFNTFPTVAAQQMATAGNVIVNAINPVAITYSLGVQHTFAKVYTAEVRYLGTHGYHLPVQQRVNRQTKISPTDFLPTFLNTPSAATLAGLTTTLASLNGNSSFVPAYVAGCGAGPGGTNVSPCFTSNITVFDPRGNSVYNGISGQLTRRFEHGLQFSIAYTYSHAIDDSTATLASTTFTPRRAQDFQNVADDRSNSALDHRHRISFVVYYDFPYFKSGNWFRRNILGNWLVTPIYTFQSGAWADLQANSDANLNGDAAGDRVFINPAGIHGVGTASTATCLGPGNQVIVGSVPNGNTMTSTTSCAAVAATTPPDMNGNILVPTVAYTAGNSSAFYIRPGSGALQPNNGLVVAGRNTILTRPINDIDVTIGKKFTITERVHFEFQAQALNLFNHPQYVAGSLNQVQPIVTYKPGTAGGTAVTNYLTPGNMDFLRPDQVLSSNPRLLQLTAKLVF